MSGMRATCDMMGSPPAVRLLATADLKERCIASLGFRQSHEPLKSAWGHQVRDVKPEREIFCYSF